MTWNKELVALLLLLSAVGCAVKAPVPDTVGAVVADPVLEEPSPDLPSPPVSGEAVLYHGTDTVVALPGHNQPVVSEGPGVTLNFEQAPLDEVVHAVFGDILKLDYSVQHPLPGTITLRTQESVPREQLLTVLESLLQANGVRMTRVGEGRYLVGAAESLRKLAPDFSHPGDAAAGFTHMVVPLRHISATEMANILKPVAGEEAFVHIDPSRNLLVLAGGRNQIDGWLEMVSIFDVDQLAGQSVGIFPLRHSSVTTMRTILQELLGSEQGGGMAQLVRILPLEQLGSLLVVTPRAHFLDVVGTWVERFDQPGDPDDMPALHVYRVRNGTAAHLAAMLNGLFGATGSQGLMWDSGVAPGLSPVTRGQGPTGAQDGVPPGGESGVRFGLGGGVRIVADEYNNALLIHALPREFARIESVLKSLDLVPTQVLIEASIIEVTLADELEFGVEWHLRNSLEGDRQGGARLNLGSGAEFGPRSPGFSYTVANSAGALRGVINALAEKSLVNVISTPSIMVLENRTANIHVGDQQPVQSAQTVTDGGTITSSIQYRDTGVKLQVTPSVNARGLVTMDIMQSVTDIGPVDTATSQRSFLERHVSSRVAVPSGETVVLGGLIRDNHSTGRLGVPVLHGIPLVGNLFGRTAKRTNRTELLVFITPRVLRGEQDLLAITGEMRARMRGLPQFDDLPNNMRTGDLATTSVVDSAELRPDREPGDLEDVPGTLSETVTPENEAESTIPE